MHEAFAAQVLSTFQKLESREFASAGARAIGEPVGEIDRDRSMRAAARLRWGTRLAPPARAA